MTEFENIDFDNKPNFMSTLAMLKEEGRVEGKIVLSLETLLKTILNFPNFDAKQLALFVVFKEKKIEQFLKLLQLSDLSLSLIHISEPTRPY